MIAVDLVTSVPDLHTARILASAGIPYISFKQNISNLNEIISWIEGPEVFIQIIDHDLPIPQVDGLIIDHAWYEQYSFMDKKILWLTQRGDLSIADGMIYMPGVIQVNTIAPQYPQFFHASISQMKHIQSTMYWLDYEQDQALFDQIFLES
jgi:hypothetical protein